MADDTNPAAGSSSRGADLRTFLIADIRGYTRFTRDYEDEAASSLAAWFAAVVRDVVSASDGELLELRGDEALCVFSSARQALRTAVELQRHLRVARLLGARGVAAYRPGTSAETGSEAGKVSSRAWSSSSSPFSGR